MRDSPATPAVHVEKALDVVRELAAILGDKIVIDWAAGLDTDHIHRAINKLLIARYHLRDALELLKEGADADG